MTQAAARSAFLRIARESTESLQRALKARGK